MGVFDTILQLSRQLFPRGRAFKMPYDGAMEKLQRALSQSESRAYVDALAIKDSLIPDNDNFTADDASDWERRLGMIDSSAVSLSDRKMAILRKMKFPGSVVARQHYLFLQGQLRDAGFDVYVYENRFIELQPELTNGPLIASGGVWYDGANTPHTYGSPVFAGNLVGKELRTGEILEVGKKYRVTVAFLQVNIPVSIKAGGVEILPIPAIVGTYTVDFIYYGGLARVAVHDDLFFNSIVSSFSVKELKLVTKTPFEVSGDSGILTDIEYGQFEYGQQEYGPVYNHKIANNIDENKDLAFNVGDNLRSTFFIGGNPVGTYADVPLVRKDEFRQLILRLKPAQTVGFTFINYV